jgi:hypothetical protein
MYRTWIQMGIGSIPNKLLLDPYALEISHDPLTITQPDTVHYQS